MEEQQARYAIYFVAAADSALHRFGSAVLGYDCYTGEDLPFPDEVAADRAGWRALTEDPRRYGFHATLKAPFRLAASATEADIVGAFKSFAALPHPIARFSPELRLLGAFVAIVPRAPCAALSALADHCTTAFDAFRAPMPADERARRRAAGLSDRQAQNLDRWGYPYVFEDFRFHMTLTGRVPAERQAEVLALLRHSFSTRHGEQPIAVDRLGLFKQDDARGRFRVLCDAALAAPTPGRDAAAR
jgi:putative phosphonate metabolism protein